MKTNEIIAEDIVKCLRLELPKSIVDAVLCNIEQALDALDAQSNLSPEDEAFLTEFENRNIYDAFYAGEIEQLLRIAQLARRGAANKSAVSDEDFETVLNDVQYAFSMGPKEIREKLRKALNILYKWNDIMKVSPIAITGKLEGRK